MTTGATAGPADRDALLAFNEEADRSFSERPAGTAVLPCQERRGFALTVEVIPPPEFELTAEVIPPEGK